MPSLCVGHAALKPPNAFRFGWLEVMPSAPPCSIQWLLTSLGFPLGAGFQMCFILGAGAVPSSGSGQGLGSHTIGVLLPLAPVGAGSP